MAIALPVIQPAPDAASGGASARGSHRLSQIDDCPRAWWLRWGLQLEADSAPHSWAIEGTVIHLAMAYHFASLMPVKPPWFDKTSLVDALNEVAKGDQNLVAMAIGMLQAYRHRMSGDGWVPVAVEHEFLASIGGIRRLVDPDAAPAEGDEQIITARIDLMAISNGLLWAIDTKSTARGYGDHLPRWNEEGEYALKWQFLVQALIIRAWLVKEGYSPSALAGIIVQRVKRKAPFDVDRNPVILPKRAYREAAERLRLQCLKELALIKEATAARGRGDTLWMPLGHYWSCFAFGSACQFRRICLSDDPETIRMVIQTDYRRVS